MPLTAQDVAEITRLLEQSDFIELRIEHEGLKLLLKRTAAGTRAGSEGAAATVPATAAASAAAPSAELEGGAAGQAAQPSWMAGAVAAAGEAHRQPPAAASDPSLREVTAPLLGIFYRAPRPADAPYVEVGSQVQEDTVVGIIEVMKLMNSVRAAVRGTVVEILAEDGAPVEYGQVLLRVAPGAQRG